jgi:fatty-acid desaturase
MNETSKYLLKVNLPVLILAIVSPFVIGVSAYTLYGFLTCYILSYLLGLNIVHRSTTHGQFSLRKPFDYIFGYLSLFCMLSDPLNFSKGHRYHHRHSDTPLDLHSPSLGTFRSFIGWMWHKDTPSPSIIIVKDLLKDPGYIFLAKKQVSLIWATIVILSFMSIHFTIGVLIAMCLAFILEMASNTWFNHTTTGVKNNAVYSWISLSSYHLDHHDYPSTIKLRDPGMFLINFLKFIKVIND